MRAMRRDHKDAYQTWLWGEVLLLGLLGAGLALFVVYPSLRDTYAAPQLRLVLDTGVTLAAAIVAVLAGVRFTVEGRRLDFLLCGGFFLAAVSTFAFSIAPVFGGGTVGKHEAWAGIGGKLLATGLIAAAPFAHGRVLGRQRALRWSIITLLSLELALWLLVRSLSSGLPELHSGDDQPLLLIFTLALQAFLSLVALVGFGLRFRAYGDDLYRWLGLAATLALFAELHYVFTPAVSSSFVSQGDFLRLMSYGVLMAGVWRAFRFAEFGRAVAEERARVAREVELEVDPGLALAPDEQIEVFRIVQEGLANVRQHAGAHRAEVNIGRRGSERFVVVRDEGVGFNGDTDPAGQGIKNLRQRAATIGGAFSLRSTPGQGTALEVTLRA